ncbi:DUF1934 domain-containing protein [Blautia sp. SG-772]|nr:DUF1934 domain-containing protein [Blautia sp. SG-772]
MTKEVLIHLKGMQTTDDPHGSDEPLELITVGEYYYRNNTHYLLYEEQMEGLDEPIRNLVKIRPGHMEVRKKGPVQTNMVFETEKQNMACYQTPYGPIQMDITTTGVNLGEEEELLEIKTEYVLGMNGQKVADCQMHIRVTPKGSKETTFFRA